MYSKILVVLALTAVAYSHDILIESNNTLVLAEVSVTNIFAEHFVASPAIWKQTKDLFINASEHEVIGKINITDLRPDKDGEVEIVAGGVGQKNVTITLRSPTIFRGYDFMVSVYAIMDENQKLHHDGGSHFNSHEPPQVSVDPVPNPRVPEDKISTEIPSDATTGEPNRFTTESGPTIVTGKPIEVTTELTGATEEVTATVSSNPKNKEFREHAVTENTEVTPEETLILVDGKESHKMQFVGFHPPRHATERN